MPSKSPRQQLQDLVVGTVRGVVKDPVGSAGKALQQGRAIAGFAVRTAGQRVGHLAPPKEADTTFTPSKPSVEPALEPEPLAEKPVEEVTPLDVAKVVAKKAPATRKPPVKKAPAKKAASSPSGKLPPPRSRPGS